MYLESIINRTIEHYVVNEHAWFEKKATPIIIKRNSKTINKFVLQKSTVDYYGIFKGKFIAFEAKSFHGKFLAKKNIKNHQENFLQFINQLDGLSFYLVFIDDIEKFFIVSSEKLQSSSKEQFNYQWFNKNAEELILSFPGIVDFLGSNFVKNQLLLLNT